jgi:hypothetical protein
MLRLALYWAVATNMLEYGHPGTSIDIVSIPNMLASACALEEVVARFGDDGVIGVGFS